MATLIGVVSQVVGEVYAVASDGTRRALSEGDRVFAGEQLVTGAAGAVAVSLSNGQELTLGRDSSLALDTQMIAGHDSPTHDEAAPPTAPSDQQLTDVEKLQAAIESGVDPTQAAEATAAGPGGAGSAGGGHSFVLLSETAGALDPVIGFPTAGFNTGPEFPDPEPVAATESAPLPENNVPVITVDPGNEGGNDQALEADLAAGSNSTNDGEFATGTIILSDADGLDDLQSVTINGTTVALGSLVGSVFAGTNGTLTITAYDSLTGVASYSYQLTSPTTDGPGIETDVFSLTVSDGTASSLPASIVIEIVDDVPNAVDDSNSVAEGAVAAISGEVLGNDVTGADTPTSFVAWGSTAASFGTFTDTGNGTYSYSLDNANPAVQALDSGQSLTETFTYTMQDADGDLDTATLTITINGSNDTPQITVDPGNEGGNDQVFEAGLSSGSNAAANSEFASGTFSLSDADGLDDLQSVTINGVTVALSSLVGSVFAGSNGSLTVTAYDSLTGVASYSYELTSPTTDGLDVETDSFSLSTSDGSASSAPVSLVIEIVDDAPSAQDDGISVAQGGLSVLIGNVLGNDQTGADTPASFVAWNNTAANFGTFNDTGGGTGTYDPDNLNLLVEALDDGESLSETFTY
ncbi:MAG: retention module-containing protein, partial [Pseudomonas sp.]